MMTATQQSEMQSQIPAEHHELVAQAVAVGFDFGAILALFVQYGPVFVTILKQLIDAFNKPKA